MIESVHKKSRMILHDKNGKELDVPVRGALPVTADRVRYPGFRQETRILKKGSIRMKGYMPLPCDILMERDVPVTLRDGITIYTDVFRPVDDAPHPTLLACSPYGKELGGQWLDDIPMRSNVPKSATSGLQRFEGPAPAYWVNHGYAVVNPDMRGAYNSEGVILFFGSDYARDGCDIIEWIARQTWCNEKVGMTGNSWLAISQWFIAALQPEHLSAIAPWEGLNDSYREVGTHGGVDMPEFVKILTDTFASTPKGGVEDCITAMSEHPVMDDYWADKAADLENIHIPTYIVASYTNAIHTYGTFEGYRRISSEEKWLRVHNNNEWQDYYTPTNVEDLRQFFDHYLKGIDNGWQQTPKVRLSVLNPGGKDVVNRAEEDFPIPRTQYKKLYLNAANASLQSEPVKEEACSVYDSDSKKSHATYRMRMEKDSEITGYIKLRLWVGALDHDDMDLEVHMKKLSPLGIAYPNMSMSEPIAKGYIRVSMRELDAERSVEERPFQSMAHEQKLTPGEIVPVDILIWPMGLKFQKGQILQITVSAYKTKPLAGPMVTIFGRAKVWVPVEGYTYMLGSKVEMVERGGNSKEVAPDAVNVKMPQDHNHGRHAIYTGGKYDSYLYVPFVPEV